MTEMVTIVHNDYDKIVDTCFWLNQDYAVKFNVELNRRSSKYNSTTNYHKEIGYATNGEYRVNINRDISAYLSIDSVKRSDFGKVSLRIGMDEIYFFQYRLQEVVKWFTSSEYKNLFAKKDGKIFMISKPNPIKVFVKYGQYIEFEPWVMNTSMVDQSIGVMMYLNSDGVNTFIDVNRLLSFNYFISNFNIYQSAITLINYLGRPENGTNYFDINTQFQSNNNKPVMAQGSFLDRVNAKCNNEEGG